MPLTPCVSTEISSKSTKVVLSTYMTSVRSLGLKKNPPKITHKVKILKRSKSYKNVRSKATGIQ